MGPVFWVLLETSITKGFKAAVAFDLGVMFADVCFIGICYLGSFQLLEDDQNKQGLFVLGGTILLLYGLFSWINRNKKSKDQPVPKIASRVPDLIKVAKKFNLEQLLEMPRVEEC